MRKHLISLERKGIIEIWFDRKILPGQTFDQEIDRNLAVADIILLLVSANFISSDYCHDVEMKQAMNLHKTGGIRVVPVILSSCIWENTPFGNLLAVPKDGKPIRNWENVDDAFLNVVEQLTKVIERLKQSTPDNSNTLNDLGLRELPDLQRGLRTRTHEFENDNLTIKQDFTEADRDKFLISAFDYISKHIERSLNKLEDKYAYITTTFRRIDANRFTAVIYKYGTAESHCKVCLRDGYEKSITYSEDDQANDDSYHDSLFVEQDGKNLYFRSMMSVIESQHEVENLTYDGAAKYYWSKLIEPLQ